MPELLKHFIVANSAVLFSLLLIAGAIGTWTVGQHVRRWLGRRSRERAAEGGTRSDMESALAEALLATNSRLDRIEALVRFDAELQSPRRRTLPFPPEPGGR